jgi:prepilin-type N-terminal cleavage/methylation domain-containing protein
LGSRVAEREGFTLIELLVALVISGVVISVLFQVLSGQGRYVEMQSAREEVQQNTRAALELIGSELRTLPPGGGIVRAATDSVTIRVPRIWGVVCNVSGPTSLDVAVPAAGGASYATNLGTGLVVNLGDAGSPVWTGAVGVTTIGAANAACAGEPLPAGVQRRTLSLSGTPQNGTDLPEVGNVAYIYDQITYRSGTSSGVPGVWVQRRVGDASGSSNQPMAGPILEGGGGLRFTYFADGSSVPLATPISDPNILGSVTRVSVVVNSVSRRRFGDEHQSKADTVLVSLRNRL